jgi:phosphotransferase family enzyme
VLLETDDGTRSLVLKCSKPGLTCRNLLVARRWLPAIGLSEAGARLLGSAADGQGERVWLIYEDLGEARLDASATDRTRVGVAIDLIARLHVRSAEHAVLPDIRANGGDLGTPYLIANVRDAVRSLDLLRAGPPHLPLSATQEAVIDRLLDRLRPLERELPDRVRMLERDGGPEVLLHGDLWTTNAFVLERPGGWQARFVDWDNAAVGRVTYDLSTFLLRFPSQERAWILDRYRAGLGAGGWRLPEGDALNVQLETAEFARYANCVVGPAVARLVDGAAWAFDELAMVADWFDAWTPVMPAPPAPVAP